MELHKIEISAISNHRGLDFSLWKLNSNGSFSTRFVKLVIYSSIPDGSVLLLLFINIYGNQKSKKKKKCKFFFGLCCTIRSSPLIWFREDWRICASTQIGVIYHKNNESSNHLFLSCFIAQLFWNRMDPSLGWMSFSLNIKSLCENLFALSTPNPKEGYSASI